MRKDSAFIIILFLLLVFILGIVLTGQERTSAEYQTEMEALTLKTVAKMQAIKVGFLGGLAVIVLFGATGIIVGLVRAAWQRSRLISPHTNGLFPIVQGRFGGQTYYHDPNRQLAGSVVYSAGPEGTTVQHLTPPNDRGEQLQVATQAQATQLVTAAGQGQGLTAQGRQLAEYVVRATAPRSASHLPGVVTLDEAIPEDRHLLNALRTDWDE
jgi:hypothetical protein